MVTMSEPLTTDHPMIRIEGLTRSFGSILAVDDLTVEAPAGRIVGLLGANGAGKTTTLNMLTTLLEPSAGTARVAGHDILDDAIAVRRSLGYVPEHGAVYEGLTAEEYLEMAGRVRGLDRLIFAGRADRILSHFGLMNDRKRRLGTFSKGMRRKVLVTAALLHDPRVLFLDEPMDGLDAISQRKLADLLRDLASRGRTILYSSHILEQVQRLCDMLIFLHRGRLLWSGDVSTLRREHHGAALGEIFLTMTSPEAETRVTWAELLEA
jgi:ABC-2 type transport system ATP-binding protein